jgi:glycine cleavage system H protein
MEIPSNLKYAKTDEWVKIEGKVATIGISDYAQEQLSDVVFVEITVSDGEKVLKNKTCATIESVKAAAEVNLPVSGKVIATNVALAETPELVNSDPYGKAWMLKVEMSDPTELTGLMDSEGYEAFCQERDH